MLALERRRQILDKLKKEKKVIVAELSQFYDVSEETIRRDLEKLEKEGLVQKIYGGAVLRDDSGIEDQFNLRKNQNIAGKQKMAELAAELVADGDHLFLDASTTAVFVARELKEKKNLTIITNSLQILLEVSGMPDWTIISTGGVMEKGNLTFLGSRAEEMIRAHYVDQAFFSCKAFHHVWGSMESKDEISSCKKMMSDSAKQSVLVVEHKKFDLLSYSVAVPLRDIDIVLTDKKPDDMWLKRFEEFGILCKYPEDLD